MNIRHEEERDYRYVEELTKRAFWNLHAPGCNEHYLAHCLRKHADFVPELDFVAELDGKIVGNIMYTKSKLVNEKNEEKTILTFGPVSVEPAYQRRGIGRKLIEYSVAKAKELGYEYIVIFGSPSNYVGLGFKSCKRYNIYVGDKIYPSAMLAMQLAGDGLGDQGWRYSESPAYELDDQEAEKFDETFEPMEKAVTNKQEEFFIMSRSQVRA